MLANMYECIHASDAMPYGNVSMNVFGHMDVCECVNKHVGGSECMFML